MQNIMIVGAGKGGTAILKILKESEVLNVQVVIDRNEDAPGILLFNKRSEEIMGVKKGQAIGKDILEVIPTSRLLIILKTRRVESNQEMVIGNGRKIITTRIPIIEENGKLMGAFAVFKDITEVVNLAEEITNLKEIQTMLQAIIHSSDDAISVVDENGRGILINPA